jgi:oligopeptide/dipeptide ABC transporter ATP-binding protein
MYLGEIVESGKIGDVITHPRHPYTRALIQAVPIPDPRFKGLGELPLKSMALGSLENSGAGCSFENRCPYSCDNCKKTVAYVTTDTAEVLCSNLEQVPSDPIYKI